MNASACTETKQVGLDAPRLVDAHLQRHVEVRVARQHGAHVGFGVDQALQALGDCQRDVLLARAQPAARARVLAAVARVDDDGREAGHFRFFGGRRRIRLPGSARLAGRLDQRGERVHGHRRIDVQHQAVAVFGNRLQGEHLRLDLGLEIQHQAHHAGTVASDAQLVDVGIAGGDLVVQFGQRRAELDAFQVEHQALRVLHREQLELDLGF
jgi:hypothetical protein